MIPAEKREINKQIGELVENSLYTEHVEKVLKDIFKLSDEGVTSMRVDQLSEKDIEALKFLGYEVEFYDNGFGIEGGGYYYTVSGMF